MLFTWGRSTTWVGVSHLRTRDGDHEFDLTVERYDQRVVAFEVRLAPSVTDAEVVHLRWLAARLGDHLLDAAVITPGTQAYAGRSWAVGPGRLPASWQVVG